MAEPELKKPEPKLVDKIKKQVEEVVEAKVVAKAYGVDITGGEAKSEPKRDETPSFASTIVGKAIDSQDKITGRMLEQEKNLREEIGALKKEAQENLNKYLQTSQERAQDVLARAQELIEKAQAEGAPENVLARFRQMKEVAKELQTEGEGKKPPSVDSRLALDLEKMREEHELKMEELKNQRDEANKKWDLQLRQMDDDSKLRWKKYDDDKDRGDKVMTGLGDLLHGAKAGIETDMAREGSGATHSNASAGQASEGAMPAGDNETVLRVQALSFPCTTCGAKVNVPDLAGEQVLDCPGCHAEYKVKPKAAV